MTRSRRVEEVIAAIGGRQHGVVGRVQLIAAGLGPDLVDRRLKDGRLRPLHRGVYLVGPIPGPRAREMAACLACGPSAVVSHRSAASLWKLLPPPPPTAPTEVILRRGNRRSRRGIRVRRIGGLRPDEVTTLDGIVITSPVRTLLDLAECATSRELERALAEAYGRRLATPERLRQHLGTGRRWNGSRALRLALDAHEPTLTRSEAEERFLALIRRARLPEPAANVAVRGWEVDFLWRRERLVVEVDGFAFHASARAFEKDRRRDAVLAGAGLRVTRVTWRQITDEPEAVLARVAQALAVRP